MTEPVGDNENMVNYHASALADLLRKKMANKLQTLVELKKEYRSYSECFSVWSDSTNVKGGNIKSENDADVFLGAINYVVEELTQLKEYSAEHQDQISTVSNEKECKISMLSTEKKGKITTFLTEKQEQSNNKFEFLTEKQKQTRKVSTEKRGEISQTTSSSSNQTKSKPSQSKLESSTKKGAKHEEKRDRKGKVGEEKCHKTDEYDDIKCQKLQSQVEDLMHSNNVLKNRIKNMDDDLDDMKSKLNEERKRRKSIECRCESGKCQSDVYSNLKENNIMLANKNKILQEENEILKRNDKDSLQAKIQAQRNSLATLNVAYKKLLDKLSWNGSRSTRDDGINRKRWLNDRFDEGTETISKRQKCSSLSDTIYPNEKVDQSKAEEKSKKIKNFFDVSSSGSETVSKQREPNALCSSVSSNEIKNDSKSAKITRNSLTGVVVLNDKVGEPKVEAKTKNIKFENVDSAIENQNRNENQLIIKQEIVRSPLKSKENFFDRKVLPKIKVEKESFDVVVSAENIPTGSAR